MGLVASISAGIAEISELVGGAVAVEGAVAGAAEAGAVGAETAAAEGTLSSIYASEVAGAGTIGTAGTTSAEISEIVGAEGSEFAEWYSQTFATEIEGLQVAEETAAAETTAFETGAETTLEEVTGEGQIASTAAGGVAEEIAGQSGPGTGDQLATPTGDTGLTGFTAPPDSGATSGPVSVPSGPTSEIPGGITGFSEIPSLPNMEQLEGIFADILRNNISETGPLGFTWEQVLQQTRKIGFGFLTTYYGIKDAGDIMRTILDNTVYKNLNGAKDSKDLLFFDPNGNMIRSSELMRSDLKYVDPFRLGVAVGRLTSIATLEFNEEGQITQENLMSALTSASIHFPEGSHVADKLFKYIASTEEFRKPEVIDDQFTRIFQVYNGDISDPYMTDDGVIAIRDETGREVRNVGNHTGIVIPPIWGEYCGMFSPNVKAPISLLDSYCFLHDQAYAARGVFDVQSDHQLVSRILQNLDRMGLQERMVAKFVAKYFSSGGTVMSSFKKQKVTDSINSTTRDLYDYLIPQNSIPVSSGLNQAGRRARGQFRDQGKENFYAGMEYGFAEQLEEEAKLHGLGGTGPQSSRANQALIEMFDKIEVVV